VALIDFIPIFYLVISVFYFISVYHRKYSLLRKKEAERYFSGSVVEMDDPGFYKSRNYTKGLSFAKEKKSGEYTFNKQAKICDTGILY